MSLGLPDRAARTCSSGPSGKPCSSAGEGTAGTSRGAPGPGARGTVCPPRPIPDSRGYRLIATDTVEERVVELQEKKHRLADAILGQGRVGLRDLTREDLELPLS